jgi:hypothetical protein
LSRSENATQVLYKGKISFTLSKDVHHISYLIKELYYFTHHHESDLTKREKLSSSSNLSCRYTISLANIYLSPLLFLYFFMLFPHLSSSFPLFLLLQALLLWHLLGVFLIILFLIMKSAFCVCAWLLDHILAGRGEGRTNSRWLLLTGFFIWTSCFDSKFR